MKTMKAFLISFSVSRAEMRVNKRGMSMIAEKYSKNLSIINGRSDELKRSLLLIFVLEGKLLTAVIAIKRLAILLLSELQGKC